MPSIDALVVFTDQRDVPWLRPLAKGFRHCFVVVRDPAGEWLACDWIKGRFAFRVYGPHDSTELINRFVGRGHIVIAVQGSVGAAARPWLRPLTCVEVVKQSLGLAGLRPFTPYGLYRALRARGCTAFSLKVQVPKSLDRDAD